MGIWKMTQLEAPPLTEDAAELRKYLLYLSNQIASMLKDLDFTLNGDVDFRNVRAKSIKADNLSVTELSAITANLGKMTAGEIFGAYIASREAAFPRAELKSSGDVFAAFHDADNYIAVESDYSGVPSLNFIHGGSVLGRIDTSISIFEMIGNGGLVLSAPAGDIDMTPTGFVLVPDWSKLKNSATGHTLQQDLDAIDARLVAGGL